MSKERKANKYPKPKILLVDMPQDCAEVLRGAGYNVAVGTFGIPYVVSKSRDSSWVSLDTCSLPNHEEQEIIIANTLCPAPTAESPEGGPGKAVNAFWQSGADGIVDPRPLYMHAVRKAFQRVLAHGGIFIVQLSSRSEVEYVYGPNTYAGIHELERHRYSNWGFLPELNSFSAEFQTGQEIVFDPDYKRLAALLQSGSKGSEFHCILAPPHQLNEKWFPLARNKYGQAVAGVIDMDNQPKGYILALPQMPNLGTIILPLLEGFVIGWCPHLFPFHEGARWLHRPEYESPVVNSLNESIEQVQHQAKERVEELKKQIAAERAANQDSYTLLNGTDAELVGAVIRTLNKLGFTKVIDVDAQAREAGEDRDLREDIQVHDSSPVLIVDVKGILGGPEDSEATQSEKHAFIRAREWSRTDVHPLTIINHQRNIPPHDRNPNPYREAIVGNAKQTGLGLMTAWDLFRLLRNKEALGWPDDVVKPIFYRTGRIEPIPEHYVGVGRIEHVWPEANAFGIIPTLSIRSGATLAIEIGDTFVEVASESLQVDDKAVGEAKSGSNCGIKCEGDVKQFKKGMRVFVIKAR